MGGIAAEAIAAQPAEQGLAMLDHVFLSIFSEKASTAMVHMVNELTSAICGKNA